MELDLGYVVLLFKADKKLGLNPKDLKCIGKEENMKSLLLR